MPVNNENNATRVSFIEHLLAIPKSPNLNGDEFDAERLDVQPRSLELRERASKCFTDKIAGEK